MADKFWSIHEGVVRLPEQQVFAVYFHKEVINSKEKLNPPLRAGPLKKHARTEIAMFF